jgi:hypothetical protein
LTNTRKEGAMTTPIQLPPPVAEDAATTPACPDEVLVADARSGLTPSQMVDRKLLALLGRCPAGPFMQSTARRGSMREATER